jgi:hypothetical protein
VFKNKALVVVTILVLVLAVIAISCAPVAKPATTTPAATATPTATTPPASTTTPPAQPAAAATPLAAPEVKTSYEAATYTNDKYGFSIKYPKSWIVKDAGTYALSADVDGTISANSLIVTAIPAAKDLSKAAKDVLDSYPSIKMLGGNATVDSTKTATLADGKTPCTQTELSAIVAVYSVYCYSVGVTKGDNSILVVAYTMSGDKKLVQEIANTLVFK